MSDLEQFRDAIRAAGLEPPHVIEADGKLHRFPTNGKRGDDAGWYVLHGDGISSGSFGDWRTGVSESWRADSGRTLTPAEKAAHRAKVEAMRGEREAEEARRKAEAAAKAAAIWQAAQPAPDDHPYLTRKGIKAHDARLHNGALVIPMRDGSDLHSLQLIQPDGEKRFLTGGRVAGCYFAIGNPKGAAALCIAEGFATGATITEATDYPVTVAFNAGNLEPVARALRANFPEATLILCADDDAETAGNPGLTKATAAARAVNGKLAVPDFGANRPEGVSDFNDLAALRGAEAVKRAIEAATVPKLRHGGKGFNLVSAADLLAASEPDTRWTWDGVLPEAGMSLVVGKPKAGKSTFAFALSIAVAGGQDFLNRHTSKGTVVYLALEEKRAEKRSSKPPAVKSKIYSSISARRRWTR